MPNLYIVATPIGNLEDISLRAIRILKEVGLIATEDTRKTKRLLSAYDIHTPLTSYYEHNKLTKLDYILERLKESDVALVSEAGMPGISDPGYELVAAAAERHIPVIPVPGASAVVTAVAASGLPTDRFTYLGFLPNRQGARRRALEGIKEVQGSIVIYEAPHRAVATLADIRDVLGDRRIAVCRELTKLHEEIFRGTVSEAITHFTAPRGEFTLVIEGMSGKTKPVPDNDTGMRLREMKEAGLTAREAIATVSEQTGMARKELYKLWLGLDDSP